MCGLTVAGITLVALSPAPNVLWRAVKLVHPAFRQLRRIDSKASVRRDFYSAFGSSLCEHIRAELKIAAEHPAKVRLQDSFTVRGHVQVDHIRVAREPGSTGPRCQDISPFWIDPTSVELHDSEAILWNGGVQLTLTLAGVELRPDAPVPASQNGAVWSVSPKKAGRLHGFLVMGTNQQRSAPWRRVTYSISAADAPIDIDVVDDLLTRDRTLSFLAAFLGPLLTLPGIISFLKQYRQRKPAKAAATS